MIIILPLSSSIFADYYIIGSADLLLVSFKLSTKL